VATGVTVIRNNNSCVSLQVSQQHRPTESCRARAENSKFRSDIGAETFDDTYYNES